ncbi:hypothetical protein [Carnobacterium iners]|uniref:hypothetical protein n=1 Tax=Carnobacterium iners TaxID=1073423 RepID=UPI0008CCE821|nr:hypothetical protein [Carnobacterium iners]SEL04641.1 beta-galactosidase [Carnobacterium iners]
MAYHDNSPENRVFKDVAEVGEILESLSAVAGTIRSADVAILYDWENNRDLNDAWSYGLETKRYIQRV